MAQWGKNDQYSDAPKFNVDAKGQTGQDQYGNTVFGVDADEVRAAGATVSSPGWIRRTEGTGGRAGRVQEEVLVAMSGKTSFPAGDATSFSNTDATASSNTTVATADDTEYPDA